MAKKTTREAVDKESALADMAAQSEPKTKVVVDHLRLTLHLERKHVEMARGAQRYLEMHTEYGIRSLSQLFDSAISRELKRLKEELKPEGGEFPRIRTRGRTGRPPGT